MVLFVGDHTCSLLIPAHVYAMYKRLNNCPSPPPPTPDSDDVLVVAVMACPTLKTFTPLPLKHHHCPRAGRRNYLIACNSKRLIACTLDRHHSTQRPGHYEI